MAVYTQGETQPMLAKYPGQDLQSVQQGVTRRFGGAWRFLFFTAASAAIAAGIIGFVEACMTETNPFEIMNQVYLCFFGFLLLILDMPEISQGKGFMFVVKFAIYKYMLILTRFTGRGLMYLFLSALVVGTLWSHNQAPFLGFVLGGYIFIIGILAIYKGFAKSLKLDKIRCSVKASCVQRGKEYINMICPDSGLTGEQFNELILQLIGEKFTDEEIIYVLNALSMSTTNLQVVTRNEFIAWTHQTRMTLL